MSISDSSSAFTDFVLNKISPEVRNSLTEKQLNEIENAIAAGSPLKKHPIDIRGIISLFFAKFYFVFLLGRDKRTNTRSVEKGRRKEGDFFASIFFFLFFTFPLILLFFAVIYITKSEFGIDIFPNSHLFEMLNIKG